MRLANFEKDQEKDKIEQVKQQVQEIQRIELFWKRHAKMQRSPDE